MTFHWIDLVIIAVIGLSVLTGLIRGFVKELLALTVWILALWAAFNYTQSVDPWLQNYITDKTARTATAFIAILITLLVVGGIINSFINFILKRSGLSGTDRLLGMFFGFLRGVFIIAFLITIIQLTSLPYKSYAKNAILYERFSPLVSLIEERMPNFIKQIKTFTPSENSKELHKSKSASQKSSTLESLNLLDLSEDFELSDA